MRYLITFKPEVAARFAGVGLTTCAIAEYNATDGTYNVILTGRGAHVGVVSARDVSASVPLTPDVVRMIIATC